MQRCCHVIPHRLDVLFRAAVGRIFDTNHFRNGCHQTRPDELDFVLHALEVVSQPDAPDEIEVCASASHEMPPAVSFEQNAPWKAEFVSPSLEFRAVDVVEVPEREATEEDAQAVCDHCPHYSQRCKVPFILALPLGLLLRCCCTVYLPIRMAIGLSVRYCTHPLVPILGSYIDLHDVHGSQEHESGEDGIRILVESRILQVMVIERNECCERQEEDSEARLRFDRFIEAKCCEEHEARGVDHRELVNKLHGICMGSVI